MLLNHKTLLHYATLLSHAVEDVLTTSSRLQLQLNSYCNELEAIVKVQDKLDRQGVPFAMLNHIEKALAVKHNLFSKKPKWHIVTVFDGLVMVWTIITVVLKVW